MAAAAVTVAPGCGAQHPRPDGGTPVLRVSEKDFRISAPATVPAVDLRLVVHTTGPDDHELYVVRAPAGGRLPLRADGVTVDEDAVEDDLAAEVDSKTPGTVTEVRLHLKPGRYVLFCNMAGHYLGGMHTTLVAG